VTDLRKDAAHRYSPAAVVAVSRTVLAGAPVNISTSYVERSNLSLRMAWREPFTLSPEDGYYDDFQYRRVIFLVGKTMPPGWNGGLS